MNEMKIQIPTQLIEDTIRMEMVRQMGNTDQLVESVVRQAMNQKKNSYDKETNFQKAVTKMIQDEAETIFEVWIAENRKNIAVALKEYLTANKQKVLTDFCEKLATNITEYGVRVDLKLENHEEDY